MITQLKAIIGFQEEVLEVAPAALDEVQELTERSIERSEEPSSDLMKTRIETLALSARTISALTKANIRTVGGLIRKKEDDLLDIEGLGPKAIQEIRRTLANFGITLR